MNDIVKTDPLQKLIAQAMSALDNATSAAEILEAKVNSAALYDRAKLLERFAQAKNAHEAMMATCRQMMADAALIEARAEVRLADEYDALQARGEVASGKDGPGAGVLDGNAKATAADIGVTRKQVHNARKVRDAEKADPGVVKRTLDKALKEKRTPLRAEVNRAVDGALNKSKPKATTSAPQEPAAKPQAADDGARYREQALTETDRLCKELAEAKEAAAASAEELRIARGKIELLRFGMKSLKSELAANKAPKPPKPPKPPLDPESAAARQIKGLKTQVTKLTYLLKNKDHADATAWATDAPFTLRGKIAKALSEQHTSPEARHAALQTWNALGANNGSKTARSDQQGH